MTQTQRTYRVQSNVALPEGVRVSKRVVRQPEESEYEQFPLTRMGVGDSFVATGYTARDLRGTIHKRSRTGSMRFISRTNKNGSARVWRVR